MLLGEYEHTIDEKNRLTLPAKFRSDFVDGVVLTRGLDGCLQAYRRPDWDRLGESRLAPLDPFIKEARRMQRGLFSGASETNLDKQGRAMIPAALLVHAKVQRDVEVDGARDHREIW